MSKFQNKWNPSKYRYIHVVLPISMNDSWVFVMKHLIIIARKHQVFQVHVPGSQNKNTRDIMNIAHSFSPGTWILMFIKVSTLQLVRIRRTSTTSWRSRGACQLLSRSVDFLKMAAKRNLRQDDGFNKQRWWEVPGRSPPGRNENLKNFHVLGWKKDAVHTWKHKH